MTQLGDSTAAAAFLDLSLSALPTQRTALLTETPQAAGLIRAMALRAELADAAGDAATARRWGRSCGTLWGTRSRRSTRSCSVCGRWLDFPAGDTVLREQNSGR